MSIIQTYQQKIEQALVELNLSDSPVQLYEPIRYILGIGGKRIRPALCLSTCHYFGTNGDNALNAALALEVFHNFTLLHDDIMDSASIRRNMPTVHTKWDVNTAILSGDAMMIKACLLILKTPAEYQSKVMDLFFQTAMEVCEGQQFDMNFEKQIDVTPFDYLEMIRLKTAVLIAASFKIGAIIGGASDTDAAQMYLFGQNLGMAFQLQDDYLDTYGDLDKFGKAIGGDILANKKTFLMVNAIQTSNNKLKTDLYKLLELDNLDDFTKIQSVINIYNQLGIPNFVKNKIQEFYSAAIENLNQISLNQDCKSELKDFASKIVVRDN